MHLRLTVSDDLEVHAAEAATEAGPFDLCGAITPKFASLIGLRIGPAGAGRCSSAWAASAAART